MAENGATPVMSNVVATLPAASSASVATVFHLLPLWTCSATDRFSIAGVRVADTAARSGLPASRLIARLAVSTVGAIVTDASLTTESLGEALAAETRKVLDLVIFWLKS